MRSAVPPSQLAYSKQEFMSDLFRWASLVKFEDRPLFAEVISCLWGKTTSEAMWVDAEHFPRLEALLSLQSLVSNLMSESGSFEIGDTSSSTSYRLRSLRQRFLSGPSSTYKPDRRARLSEWHPIDEQEGEEIIYTQEKQPPDPDDHLIVMGRITVLMAGAIFGAIIFFLCWTRPNFDMRFLSTSASVTWEDWASNRILSQNCIILAMYLGPSSLQETGGLYKTDELPYEVDETFLGGQGCHPIVNDLEHLEATWLSEESDHQIANYESMFEGDFSMNDTSTNDSPKSSTCLTTPLPTAAASSSVFFDTPDPVTASPKPADTVHCPRCRKPFPLGKNGRRGQTSNLGKHMRLYHPEDVPNHTRVLYKCKHGCPYEDPVKSNVKAHENRHCSKRKGTKPRSNGKWRQGT